MEEEEDFLSPWKEKQRQGKGKVGGARDRIGRKTGGEKRKKKQKETGNK